MALPRTISGVTFPASHTQTPPIRDSNGNHYVIVLDSGTVTDIEAWKADNGDNTWAEADSTNKPALSSTVGSMGVYWEDGLTRLYIVSQFAVGVGATVDYHEFGLSDDGTSPDTWITTDQAVIDPADSNITAPSCDIARRSDGDLIIFYQDATENIKGTRYDRVSYITHEGTAWGDSSGAVDDGGTVNYIVGGIEMGASDKAHLVYNQHPSSTVLHKSLNSSNTLSSAESLDSSYVPTSAINPVLAPIYYDAGGTERITAAWIRTGSDRIVSAEVDNDGTPSSDEVAINQQPRSLSSSYILAKLAVDHDTDTVYVIFVNNTDSDGYINSNVNSGGWSGSDTEILDVVTINRIAGANIYQIDNGDTVLAYVYNDGGAVKYNEYVVVSAAADTSLPIFQRKQIVIPRRY